LEFGLEAEFDTSLILVGGALGVGCGVSVAVDGATDVSFTEPEDGSSKLRSSG
jgi:hypothetical protein